MFNIKAKISAMIKSGLIFDLLVYDRDNGDNLCYGFGIVPGECVCIKYDKDGNLEAESCIDINKAFGEIDMASISGFCEFTIVDPNIGFMNSYDCNLIYA